MNSSSCESDIIQLFSFQDLHTSAWFLTLETSTAFGFWLDCITIAFTAVVSLSFLILDSGMASVMHNLHHS